MSVQDNHGFGSAEQQDHLALRTDEMTLIQSVSDQGLLAHGVAAVIVTVTLLRIANLTHLAVWLVCMFCAIAIRYLLYVAYKRAQADLKADKYWGRIIAVSNFLIGAGWGWAGYAFFDNSHGTSNAASVSRVGEIVCAEAAATAIASIKVISSVPWLLSKNAYPAQPQPAPIRKLLTAIIRPQYLSALRSAWARL